MVFIGVMEASHYRERKELYNRIMASDLNDYKQNEGKVKVNKCKNIIERNYQNFVNGTDSKE
jgi:hypothetical protein